MEYDSDLGASITAAIIRAFATASNESRRCVRAISDVDALITDLKHELNVSIDSPAEQKHTKTHSPVRLNHCDLQTLADLIAERVHARIDVPPVI